MDSTAKTEKSANGPNDKQVISFAYQQKREILISPVFGASLGLIDLYLLYSG